MDSWRIFVDPPRSAAQHMASDEQLAREARLSTRLFQWHPALSFGWKQPVPDWCESSRWQAAGVEMIERPTGGGIALHGSDVSLAVVIPRGLSVPLEVLMQTVCDSAVRLCQSYGVGATALLDVESRGRVTYCLTQPSPYAVLVNGRKLAGFALRRYPQSWLIQGALLVRAVPDVVMRALPITVREDVTARAISLAEAAATTLTVSEVANRWAAHWTSWWDACALEVVA